MSRLVKIPGRACAVLAAALLMAACTIGSSTTERPAVNRPAIGPDGTFWDAVNVSERMDTEAFRFIVTPQFLHSALLPAATRAVPTSQREFNSQRERLYAELVAAAERSRVDLEFELDRVATGYMVELRHLLSDQMVVVGEPRYDVQYRDEFGRASGPNLAAVDVTIYPKTPLPEDYEPRVIIVRFVQDGHRWLIDALEPDTLRGAYALVE
jgi:hypothetical protein